MAAGGSGAARRPLRLRHELLPKCGSRGRYVPSRPAQRLHLHAEGAGTGRGGRRGAAGARGAARGAAGARLPEPDACSRFCGCGGRLRSPALPPAPRLIPPEVFFRKFFFQKNLRVQEGWMHPTGVEEPSRRRGPHRRALVLSLATVLALLAAAPSSRATIFATVRGIVHDSQHRPMAGAGATQTTTTDAEGAFVFAAVPLGSYRLTAQHAGMAPATLDITVASGTAPIYHLELRPAPLAQTVVVSAAPAATETPAAPARTFLGRHLLAETPGTDRTVGLNFLTDFVPGAVVVHDQVHIRGGHQMLWEIDGVPVPNTSIATNVGPQFDPRDIAELEVQRGAYSADTGTRLYSVLNVVPRSGFEDNRFGEFRLGYGRFHQAEAYLAAGSHTERLGWYGSLNGWRGDYGLETPVIPVLHDAA